MPARRFALLIVALAIGVGLALALVPTSHRYPAGTIKNGGYVEERTVSCGMLFAPKNPRILGHGDECDSEHNERLVLVFGITSGGLFLAAAMFGASQLRRRVLGAVLSGTSSARRAGRTD
jgi:hypothetical protein